MAILRVHAKTNLKSAIRQMKLVSAEYFKVYFNH